MPTPPETGYSPVRPHKMTTIEHIYDQIGGLSWFQLVIVLMVYSIKIVSGWSMMLMSFAGYINDYICVTDPQTNYSLYTRDAEAKNFSALNVCSVNGTKCQEYQFLGTKRTVIAEWHLVCDLRWMKATITSIQMGGVFTGAVLGGLSGDYFGRRKTLYSTLLLHIIFNVISAYSVSWQMFAAMRFFIGGLVGVALVMAVPYPTEFFPQRWRHIVPAIPFWPLGVMAFSCAAWILEDWADLQIGAAILSGVMLLGYFYIPESPRWLATQGRLEESYAALEKIARLNGRILPPSAMDVIKRIAQDEKTSHQGREYTYRDLFRTKRSVKLTVIFSFQWMVLSIIFYGLNFAVSSFVGNLYLNIFLMNLVQLPALLVTFLVIDRTGRRLTCLIFLTIATLVSFACVGLHLAAPESLRGNLISILCLVATLIIAGCWAASQVWVTESYPTVTRSLGYGFANITSRVGAIMAPFVVNLDELPLFSFVMMGTIALVSTVMTLFIPETHNLAMAETVNDEDHPYVDPGSSDEDGSNVKMVSPDTTEVRGNIGDFHETSESAKLTGWNGDSNLNNGSLASSPD